MSERHIGRVKESEIERRRENKLRRVRGSARDAEMEIMERLKGEGGRARDAETAREGG